MPFQRLKRLYFQALNTALFSSRSYALPRKLNPYVNAGSKDFSGS